MTDAEIVNLYWARKESAISETERLLGPYLRKIAENVLGSGEDAAECVNDTYLAAWESIPPARPESLRAFLGRIVRQKAIDRLRAESRSKRRPSEGLLSLEELGECVTGEDGDSVDRIALTQAIGDYLRTVSREARTVFVGRYYYMDSIAEIARYCGVSTGKVKTLLYRTRQGLREYLEKEDLI